MKDSTFGVLLTLFFILIVIFIVTTDEPDPNVGTNPFEGGFSSFIPLLFLGLGGAVILSYFGRRKRPNDLQSMDQLYRNSKLNQNKVNEDLEPEDPNQKNT